MGVASSANLFWSFVRYITGDPYASDGNISKQDMIKLATAFAVANTAELGGYDDGVATTATAYTDVQLPGVTGADLDSANTFALKNVVFKKAVYPGASMNVADTSVSAILPRYGL